MMDARPIEAEPVPELVRLVEAYDAAQGELLSARLGVDVATRRLDEAQRAAAAARQLLVHFNNAPRPR